MLPSAASVERGAGLAPAVGRARPLQTPDVGWRLDATLRVWLPRLLATAAALSGWLGPLWAARSARSAVAWDAYCAGVTSACLFFLALVWLAQSRDEGGASRARVARRRISTALRLSALDLRELARAPKRLKLLIISRLTLGVALVGLALSSALSLWQLIHGSPVGSQLAGISLWSGSLLVGSALLRWALRSQEQPSDISEDELAIATREFPAIVDLALPLEVDSVFMHPTLLHRVVAALAEWQQRAGWVGAEGYTAALQRHLHRCMPQARIDRQRWCRGAHANGAAGLVVDDTVLILAQVGFNPALASNAVDRVRASSELWGNRPIILVVFEAPSGDVLDSDAARSLLALHESALILTLLMPAAAVNAPVIAAHPAAKLAPPKGLGAPTT